MIPFNTNSILRAKEVADGQIVVFLNEGEWREFKFKDQPVSNGFVMQVEYKGEEKEIKVTKGSFESIMPVYGPDTKEWIGKKAKIMVIPTQKGNSILLKPVSDNKVDVKTDEIAWDEK